MDTFAACVEARAADDGGGVRVGDRRWSWREVIAEARDRARHLGHVSPRPKEGDTGQVHVGLMMENTAEFVFWLFAAALAGAVAVGVNTTRRGTDLIADITHTDCDLLVVDPATSSLLTGLDTGIPVMSTDDTRWRDAPDPESDRAPAIGPDTLLLLMFSSGSTGRPKAVRCSQGRLAGLAIALADRVALRRDSVTYLCTPLFHGNAIMLNLAPALYRGATVALAPRFSASRFAADIHRYGVTFVNYVGRILAYVLAQPETPADATSTLELAYGTEASISDIHRFGERFGCQVVEGYGMSEGVVRINRVPEAPAGSLGVPVSAYPVEVRDPMTGLECPRARFDPAGGLTNATEAIGQIVAVGGAEAFEGYYRNPAATAERVRGADFWTGDLAFRDAEGWFHFAGRSTDWLRVDGENLAAGPVERILERHPQVCVAAAYGVPDPRTGDQLMCALQLDAGPFDPGAFARFLTAQPDLSTKAAPRFVRITDQIPVTGSNKVSKTPLRAEAWATDDDVWWRPGRDLVYVPFGAEERASWEDAFAQHSRTAHLPHPPS